MTLRDDCNLVVTNNGTMVIATDTAGRGTNYVAMMQFDENFVLYDGSRSVVWSTNTGKFFGFYILFLQPYRNAFINGSGLWESGTKVA